ncbi:hypothetical protein PoB_002501600 [Plakobranchus ocellatus]|uniref:Uncharacterized protein n=1 Tax=Plakobranchus ocellatus TaxID=259542 RepID=A0AAV3ZH79_9GAST|nr:hypothetical protein PoB_002501600 [Plakobranchus ocellatus]
MLMFLYCMLQSVVWRCFLYLYRPHSVPEALTLELHAKACTLRIKSALPENRLERDPYFGLGKYGLLMLSYHDAGKKPTINALAGRGVDGFFVRGFPSWNFWFYFPNSRSTILMRAVKMLVRGVKHVVDYVDDLLIQEENHVWTFSLFGVLQAATSGELFREDNKAR